MLTSWTPTCASELQHPCMTAHQFELLAKSGAEGSCRVAAMRQYCLVSLGPQATSACKDFIVEHHAACRVLNHNVHSTSYSNEEEECCHFSHTVSVSDWETFQITSEPWTSDLRPSWCSWGSGKSMKSRLGPSKLILRDAHEGQDSKLCESPPRAEYPLWCQGHQCL